MKYGSIFGFGIIIEEWSQPVSVVTKCPPVLASEKLNIVVTGTLMHLKPYRYLHNQWKPQENIPQQRSIKSLLLILLLVNANMMFAQTD